MCVLLYTGPLSQTARARLRPCTRPPTALKSPAATSKSAVPANFSGARQSGAAMLRFADLEQDGWLIEPARGAAAQLLADYPDVVTQAPAALAGCA